MRPGLDHHCLSHLGNMVNKFPPCCIQWVCLVMLKAGSMIPDLISLVLGIAVSRVNKCFNLSFYKENIVGGVLLCFYICLPPCYGKFVLYDYTLYHNNPESGQNHLWVFLFKFEYRLSDLKFKFDRYSWESTSKSVCSPSYTSIGDLEWRCVWEGRRLRGSNWLLVFVLRKLGW